MKKPTYLIAISIALLGINACSGGSGSDTPTAATSVSPAAPPATSISSRPIIDNEDLMPGLKGVDANNNGVRDDIDRLIAKKYAATTAMKKAAEQDARTLQKALTATTKVQARISGNEIMRSGSCARKSIPDLDTRMQMSKDIEALTANTKERFTAYWLSAELSGGMVFSQAQEPVCD